jgi:hypothetical protein
MKYLKLFEAFDSGWAEFKHDQLMKSFERIFITSDIDEKLFNLVSKKCKEWNFNISRSSKDLLILKKSFIDTDLSWEASQFYRIRDLGPEVNKAMEINIEIEFRIRKYEDDWFVVSLNSKSDRPSVSSAAFECDQLIGIENLLDDKLSILP